MDVSAGIVDADLHKDNFCSALSPFVKFYVYGYIGDKREFWGLSLVFYVSRLFV